MARDLREQFETFVDAFSGDELDLMTQTAALWYQEGAQRSAALGGGGAAPQDYEQIGDAALARRRAGMDVRPAESGSALDASELLKQLLAPALGWVRNDGTAERRVA